MSDAPPSAPPLSAGDQAALLDAAEEVIGSMLRGARPEAPPLTGVSRALSEPGAAFVTLRRDGRLLGCIGSIEPVRPLIVDVAENATGAAFRDPRLPPLSVRDYEQMEVKVSVLSPLTPMAVANLDELRKSVEPGADGLLLTAPGHRGTFLPSVWEQLPDRDDFLDALWQKASLRPGTWPRGITVERYRTFEFGRSGPRALPT